LISFSTLLTALPRVLLACMALLPTPMMEAATGPNSLAFFSYVPNTAFLAVAEGVGVAFAVLIFIKIFRWVDGQLNFASWHLITLKINAVKTPLFTLLHTTQCWRYKQDIYRNINRFICHKQKIHSVK